MRIIIKTNNKDHRKVLEKYAPLLQKMIESSSKQYNVELPDSIVFRPMIKRNNQRTVSSGRAGFTRNGYYISLNLETFNGDINYGLTDTLAEEAAHIVADIYTGEMRHCEVFQMMYDSLLANVRAKIFISLLFTVTLMGCEFLQTEFRGYTMEQNFTSWAWTILLVVIFYGAWKKHTGGEQ